MSNKSIPKETILRKWKDRFRWPKIIDVDSKKKMICKVCTGQEEKLKLMPNTNFTFLNGSTNFNMSSLSDHTTTDGHTCPIKEQENEKAIHSWSYHHTLQGRSGNTNLFCNWHWF